MDDDMVIYFYGLGKEACWRWIKQWAIVNQDYNALWFDEEYAKKSKWGGITAPPLYLICVHDGLEWAAIEFTHELWGADMTPSSDKYPYTDSLFSNRYTPINIIVAANTADTKKSRIRLKLEKPMSEPLRPSMP